MKKYILFVLVLFFSMQAFAQRKDLENLYKIPTGQLIKLYKHTDSGDIYFFDTKNYSRIGFIYVQYLLFKDPRVISMKRNAKTSVITLYVSSKLKHDDFKNQIIEAIKELHFVIENYTNYEKEIENIIYEGRN